MRISWPLFQSNMIWSLHMPWIGRESFTRDKLLRQLALAEERVGAISSHASMLLDGGGNEKRD